MERLTISISGPDNIGKTTLLSLFPRTWPVEHFGGIHKYDPAFGAIVNDGCSTWFFGGAGKHGAATNETFVRTIVGACRARDSRMYDNDQQDQLIGAVLDRSAVMFEAVCIARIAYINDISVILAETELSRILIRLNATFPTENIRIVLRRKTSIENAVEWCLSEEARFNSVTEPYVTYQNLLHQALYRQIEAGRYTTVLEREPDETFLTTLGKITETIQQNVEDPAKFPPLLRYLNCAVALGGLSECGKSTIATEIVRRAVLETSGGAFRLKIGYLLDCASVRLGQSVYDLADDRQALELVHELDRFSIAHRWLKVITLESLHRFSPTKRIRELIGAAVPGTSHAPSRGQATPKFAVVYLDTPLDIRIKRTEAEGKRFDHGKDEVKRSRGAHQIREIADIIVANDGEFDITCDEVVGGIDRLVPAWKS